MSWTVIVLWLLHGSVVGAPGQEAPIPEAWFVVEPKVIQFGAIYDFPIRQQEILLMNHGNVPVQIRKVQLSCELCLDYELSSNSISPGDVAVLKVLFNPLGYDGDVSHKIHVVTDVADVPPITIPLQADVRPLFRVIGGPLSFDKLGLREDRSMHVVLRPSRVMETDLSHAEVEHQGFSAEIRPTEVGEGYRLQVQTVPSYLEEGVLRSRVLLREDPSGDVVAALPLTAVVPPPFHVTPGRLIFERVDREQLRIIFLHQTFDDPQELMDVLVPAQDFRVEIFRDFSLPNYRINVYAYRLDKKSGEIGSVVLKMSGDPGRTVQVPVVVRERQVKGELPVEQQQVETEGTSTCEPVGPTRSASEVIGNMLEEHFGAFGLFPDWSTNLQRTTEGKR